MALTILPRTTDPGGAPTAQAQLQTIIDDPLTVVVIVYGEGVDVERAIEIAVGRATAKPEVRRVVWCPDPSVLSADQAKRYSKKNAVIVAIGLENKIADSLDADDSQSIALVEKAFLNAEAQSQED
jgi:hypothetical protein